MSKIHLEEVQQALHDIDLMWPGIFDEQPQSDQTPYTVNHGREALVKTGRYRCAGNLLWLNFTLSATPNIPYNRSSIKRLVETFFSTPTDHFPDTVVVGAPPSCPAQAPDSWHTPHGRLQVRFVHTRYHT